MLQEKNGGRGKGKGKGVTDGVAKGGVDLFWVGKKGLKDGARSRPAGKDLR